MSYKSKALGLNTTLVSIHPWNYIYMYVCEFAVIMNKQWYKLLYYLNR